MRYDASQPKNSSFPKPTRTPFHATFELQNYNNYNINVPPGYKTLALTIMPSDIERH